MPDETVTTKPARKPVPPWKLALSGVGVVVIFGVALYLRHAQAQLGTVDVIVAEQWHVKAMVAATPAQQETGLDIRDSLGPDEGMYFIFDTAARHPFWMKGMKFPIDILWMNGETLVDMTTDVKEPDKGAADDELPTFQPMVPADRVLEVPAGYAQAHGLKLGVTVVPRIDTYSAAR